MDRQILFKAEMAHAILVGRKTQTRRVITPQPECELPGAYFDAYNGGPQWNWWLPDGRMCNSRNIHTCPYGVSGDELWVRESHTFMEHELMPSGKYYVDVKYSDGRTNRFIEISEKELQNIKYNKKRPGIYMPRWASRLLLRVSNVRAERLQDITESDAKAEGTEITRVCVSESFQINLINHTVKHIEHEIYRDEFKLLWNKINAKRGYGWDTNPWVWVIEFMKTEGVD